MARISVDINEEWLRSAQLVLGTDTKVATINAALHTVALRRHAEQILDAFDSVDVVFEASADAWRYGGGRDLSRVAADARTDEAA